MYFPQSKSYKLKQITYPIVARNGNVNIAKWGVSIAESNDRNADIGSLSNWLPV